MRLTPNQKKLLDYLWAKRLEHRGGWVRSVPVGTKEVTINTLMTRGLLEDRFVRARRSRYPVVDGPIGPNSFWRDLRLSKGRA